MHIPDTSSDRSSGTGVSCVGLSDKVKKIYELVAREGEWLVLDDMLNETPLRATCHSPDNQE